MKSGNHDHFNGSTKTQAIFPARAKGAISRFLDLLMVTYKMLTPQHASIHLSRKHPEQTILVLENWMLICMLMLAHCQADLKFQQWGFWLVAWGTTIPYFIMDTHTATALLGYYVPPVKYFTTPAPIVDIWINQIAFWIYSFHFWH